MKNKNQITLKLLNSSKKVYSNFNYIYIYNLFINNIFIIFLDYKQLKNKEMYQLKNTLYEFKVASKILLKKDKNKLFNSDFSFLSNNLFCIFINDITNFNKICNILSFKNIIFFYSFKKKISNLVNNINKLNFIGGKVFITIHFIIYKLILNIILLILYLILILIKYINIK
jgi:hypothetical protein